MIMAEYSTPPLGPPLNETLDVSSYNQAVEDLRPHEFPSLDDQVYLDFAGTPPISKTLLERVSADLTANLYGNPHAFSSSSQLSTRTLEDTRHKALSWLGADPEEYDLIFVANATAAIKLVGDIFRAQDNGFWYGYHKDSHTSLVGLREEASAGHHCFENDVSMLSAIDQPQTSGCEGAVELFAYPAQSNMTGHRLPLDWCKRIRKPQNCASRKRYSLVDAAAFLSTSPLDLSDCTCNPDMISLSFYKMFGFPDLGGLLVRHDMAPLFEKRAYFGGGTVDMAVALKEQWHIRKSSSIHAGAEDGTPAFHSILALNHAIDVQRKLFGSQWDISKHASRLTKQLYEGLQQLKHPNGSAVCGIYNLIRSTSADFIDQGPILTFNFRRSNGEWYSTSEVEKLTSLRNIHLRSGGLCNPAGLATALALEPWEMQRNFSAGFRCGNENDIMSGKPTASLRVSLGAASTETDVKKFISFCEEYFVERSQHDEPNLGLLPKTHNHEPDKDLFVESLAVYPIKSCAAWEVPPGVLWDVRQEGLAWDREWCLVHDGTGAVLSQKRHPEMSLFKPRIDLQAGRLIVAYAGPDDNQDDGTPREISIPLSEDPTYFVSDAARTKQKSKVCGDLFPPRMYADATFHRFFSSRLAVPCSLVRMSDNTFTRHTILSTRQLEGPWSPRLRLSNESPILTILRSSLNKLNEDIKASGGKAVRADAFRANIVVAENYWLTPGTENPFADDYWSQLRIRGANYKIMGPCRRCQMVNIDQRTASKMVEPFSTLARTRRSDGKVWFGQHTCLDSTEQDKQSKRGNFKVQLMVGDPVRAVTREN